MQTIRRLALPITALLAAFPPTMAAAQGQQYDVTVIGQAPGAYLTYGRGLNGHGTVVGMAIFIPGGRKGWLWTESHGFVILPDPPGHPDSGANDITNSGVIAGDGGGDSGQPWRYDGATYEMLGILPGTAFAKTVGISELGSVTGTCYGTQFYTPHHSFLAAPGAPIESILDDSYAGYINDVDQVTGTAPGNVAYRYTPGAGVQLLPPLGDRFLTDGYSISNAGHVVGRAASPAEHSGVPFLFTDAGGMQEIGNFGGRALAKDINELGEVVGDWEPSSGDRRPWVWSASEGVRLLKDVIPPGTGLSLRYVARINNAGQILCDARNQNSDIVQVLLTPTGGDATSYCDPPMGNSVSAGGALLSHVSGQPGGVMVFQVDDSPTRPGILYFGVNQIDQPFGCGRRCVGGAVVRSSVQSPSTTSFQITLDTSATATDPFNIQYWYRDPDNAPSCGNVFNLTNALAF